AYLEEFGISPIGNGRGIEAQHYAPRERARAERALHHWHEPARPKNFVAAARARLLLRIHESVAMKHEHPCAYMFHEHVMRRRNRLDARAGAGVHENRVDERFRVAHVHAGHRMRSSVLHGLSVERRAVGREWQIFERYARAAISGFANPLRSLA